MDGWGRVKSDGASGRRYILFESFAHDLLLNFHGRDLLLHFKSGLYTVGKSGSLGRVLRTEYNCGTLYRVRSAALQS